MALLRWIHLRKLVPLTELLGGVQSAPVSGARPVVAAPKSAETFVRKAAPVVPPVERRAPRSEAVSVQAGEGGGPVAPKPVSVQAGESGQKPVAVTGSGEASRDAFLLEIRKSKAAFYNTVVAQAQKIEFGLDRVTFSFLPAHRILREQVDTNRQWLEQIASNVAGKRMTVGVAQADAVQEPVGAVAGQVAAQPKPADLKTTAMADSAVQAMLDVFPAEIENVEEIE